MKRPKRIAALLLAGFFVFAPPGTMIFSFVIAAGLIRHFVYRGAAVEPVEAPPTLQTPTPAPTPSPTPTPQHTPAATASPRSRR